jgi:hypothetical protein
MEGVQYFTGILDKATGQPPAALAGSDTTRTLVMYTGRLFVPTPAAANKYVAVATAEQKADLIGRLPPADGLALSEAIDEETRKLGVQYKLPDFNCAACSKRNEELFLNFENLLFIKLQGNQ